MYARVAAAKEKEPQLLSPAGWKRALHIGTVLAVDAEERVEHQIRAPVEDIIYDEKFNKSPEFSIEATSNFVPSRYLDDPYFVTHLLRERGIFLDKTGTVFSLTHFKGDKDTEKNQTTVLKYLMHYSVDKEVENLKKLGGGADESIVLPKEVVLSFEGEGHMVFIFTSVGWRAYFAKVYTQRTLHDLYRAFVEFYTHIDKRTYLVLPEKKKHVPHAEKYNQVAAEKWEEYKDPDVYVDADGDEFMDAHETLG